MHYACDRFGLDVRFLSAACKHLRVNFLVLIFGATSVWLLGILLSLSWLDVHDYLHMRACVLRGEADLPVRKSGRCDLDGKPQGPIHVDFVSSLVFHRLLRTKAQKLSVVCLAP
mmetsp:Transcript_11879/g.31824  ORF Transcript_11879/g.31824 Transcript_11879/m.31824 type:complete len:114 (+) Transcript_11879:247-588(+)